ncbi:PREDICTED: uncharacterized protein LOC101296308 [Fragaria vesca subsp. vesca]
MIAVRPKHEEMEVRFAAKPYSTDDDSAGSSEEMDSPRSVQGRWRRSALKKVAYVHSQILRIREEDSHLGESSAFGAKEKVAHAVASRVDVVLLARPVLPCSPLRNTVNALH